MKQFPRYYTFLIGALLILNTSFRSESNERDQLYRSYVDQHYRLAQVEQMEYGIPASVTLAQALVETDGGTSILARRAKNHFGIKCKSSWFGPGYFYIDDDRDAQGNLTPSCFRVYTDVTQSYRDHSEFLKNRERYQKLFNYDVSDYKSWCYGLKECGYATSDAYAKKLIACIERYNLHTFDTEMVRR